MYIGISFLFPFSGPCSAISSGVLSLKTEQLVTSHEILSEPETISEDSLSIPSLLDCTKLSIGISYFTAKLCSDVIMNPNNIYSFILLLILSPVINLK